MFYPSFINNDKFYHLDNSKSDLEQLSALTANIKHIHELGSKHYDNFEALIAEYLKSGIEIFQMQTGIVSNITVDKDYIVKDVVTNLEVIHPGDVFELEGTYCREVYSSKKTLGFPNIGNMPELKNHPVYVNLKLESYLSAPIFVDDKLYGTLNFTSTNPREYGFSENEKDLISMMADSIGNFILLQDKEKKLEKSNLRLKEFVGYVAHDLRGPIGAINSLTHLATSRQMDSQKVQNILTTVNEESGRSLELINTILEQSALGTGKITLNKSDFNVRSFIQDILKSFESLIQEKNLNISQSIDEDDFTNADKERLSQVIYNLLVNAFKYSNKASSIDIIFTSIENKFIIKNMIDSKPSTLDDQVYKSVGFGMDIARDILRLHHSELKVNADKTHYHVEFSL